LPNKSLAAETICLQEEENKQNKKGKIEFCISLITVQFFVGLLAP
jgi:hypothetical protein